MDCPIISNEIAVDVKQTKRTQRQTQTIFAARLWRKTESKNSDGDVDEGPDPLPPRRITDPLRQRWGSEESDPGYGF